MRENKNEFIVLIALCVCILFGGDYLVRKFFAEPAAPPAPEATLSEPPRVLPSPKVPKRPLPLETSLGLSKRILINSPKLEGSLNLSGPRIDDLRLKGYHVDFKKGAPEIRLLSPEKTKNAYYTTWTWEHVAASDQALPSEETVWQVEGDELAPGKPVILTWNNQSGLLFKHIFTLDEAYMFSVISQVTNQGTEEVKLRLKRTIHRHAPKVESNMMVFQGIVGVIAGNLQEITYDKLMEKGRIREETARGWLGLTDKYWLVSFAPKGVMDPEFSWFKDLAAPIQVSSLGETTLIAPGLTRQKTTHLFAGAKNLMLLDKYEKDLKIKNFDLAVDFGWFYFLTKPIFYLLNWLKGAFGSFGAAILILTVLLKLLFLPLANRSYKSMARMRKMQPVLEELKARYKDTPQKMSQEIMALYKREKINPASGCLPMLLQIPFFFALYKVLSISIEMRHAPFWGWISDLSAPDPTNIFTLFGLIPWNAPSFLHLGLWPILMGLSMFLQQKINPPPTDPTQRKMFVYVMPLVFTFMLAKFAAGLVIYWTWSNLLSVLQQWFITRKNLKNGTAPPENGKAGSQKQAVP